MIRTLLAAAALTIGLNDGLVAQEAGPAAKTHQQPQVHHQPEVQHQLETARHYSLVMVSFVNNGTPQAVSPTTQTIIGSEYPTADSCGTAAQGAWGAAPGPNKELKKETDMLRLYFVCVVSDK
jgi:hypothetical protein